MDVEKVTEEPIASLASPPDEDAAHGRTIAFPGGVHDAEKQYIHLHPKGIEMKRSITQEERELAAAGYDHLQRPKGSKEADDGERDILEHRLPIETLLVELQTSFDIKDPGRSTGLKADEAHTRIQRDGPNVLTPPKKKSGLRKVRVHHFRKRSWQLKSVPHQVPRSSIHDV